MKKPFLSWEFPYPSARMPVFAKNVVACSQPLAAQAGARMLLNGGNAVDAALAAAISLTVLEPVSNGLGSDAFAMVWDGQGLHGFNGSGKSPKAWSFDRFAEIKTMPPLGWDTVTVPGAVDTWIRLSEKFGKLPFEDLFEPAISHARDGYLVSPIIAKAWANARDLFVNDREFSDTFLPGRRAPMAGELFRCPDMARSLEEIARSKAESFYRGNLAEKIIAQCEKRGGLMTHDDLANHRGQWVTPLEMDYHGVTLHELPPNGQGLAALMALGILNHHDIRDHGVDSAQSIHLQVEAMKLAFLDAHAHIADPEHMVRAPESFLSDSYLCERAKMINPDKAFIPHGKIDTSGGTVYLCAADESGMMVSYIQSNYAGFGSGVVIAGTGISLHNRARGFCLEPDHPNRVDGAKRPYHTIIPGFVSKDGLPLMSFGVMGAHMQPQGHLQMVTRIFDHDQNPQTAADAPRWHLTETFELALEPGFDKEVVSELRGKGHHVTHKPPVLGFGGAQLILKLDDGYCAASDPRKDGQAVGF